MNSHDKTIIVPAAPQALLTWTYICEIYRHNMFRI